MEHVTPRLLAIWLVGALALSLAVVGCGTITSQDPPLNRLASTGTVTPKDMSDAYSALLKPCKMSNGGAGLKFDDLCLPAPPAGWTTGKAFTMSRDRNGKWKPVDRNIVIQPASFLTLPDTRECRPSILETEAVQV